MRVVLRWIERPQNLGSGEPCQCGIHTKQHHHRHALLGARDVPKYIIVLIQMAKLLAKGQVADNVDREVLRLERQIHGPIDGALGHVLALDEVDERRYALVNIGLEVCVFLAGVLQIHEAKHARMLADEITHGLGIVLGAQRKYICAKGWAKGPGRGEAAYACGHFGSEHIVLLVVSQRDEVVAARVEADGIIPLRLLVLGPHGPLALDELRVICNENVGRDASDMA